MAELNNNIEFITEQSKKPRQFAEKCEEKYNAKIKRIAEDIAQSGRTEIVMLAGPSSAGKTTTAKKLCEELSKFGVDSYTVSLDDFYLDNCAAPRFADGSPDFETVDALDIKCFERTVKSLMENNEAYIPQFDFVNGKRKDEYKKLQIKDSDVIIVEGLHALNPLITEHLPKERLLKIYISVSSRIYGKNGDIILNKRNLRFVRRLVRDYKFRGNSVEKTFKMWMSVRYGEDTYLFPFKGNADITVNTIHLYEPCVLKDTAVQLLCGVDKTSEFYNESQRLMKSLDEFPSIDSGVVPENSLLREFIG